MANNVMHYTYYLIVLAACIDPGDGRWKRKDKKENLHHDIEIFRKMADKVEQEIDAFYDEFPNESIEGDKIDVIYNYKYVQNIIQRNLRNIRIRNESEVNEAKSYPNSISDNATSDILPTNITKVLEPYKHVSFRGTISNTSDEQTPKYNWPKFEDILLEMGKRYDWKNDRWIKVRQKYKETHLENVQDVNNYVDFHEKHKFSYRIVKLNRNKSKRNVVVAVSAVR